jgi:predicted nuclease of predicted toxin-antitoxin system
MRLLLDACVHARLARALPAHQVSTVVQQGWSGIKNGRLLALAAGHLDALITVDKNLPYQHNTRSLPLAVIVLDAASNELPCLLPILPALERALACPEPCSYRALQADA